MERNTTQKMLPSRARDAPLEREEDSSGTEQPTAAAQNSLLVISVPVQRGVGGTAEKQND